MARILVIDDNPFKRELLQIYLIPYRHTITEAENGQEGLDQVELSHPDLIIVDLIMPVMDGYDFCVALRKNTNLNIANIPLLVYSGMELEKIDILASSVYIDRVIPINAEIEEVAEIIDEVLQKKMVIQSNVRKLSVFVPTLEEVLVELKRLSAEVRKYC